MAGYGLLFVPALFAIPGVLLAFALRGFTPGDERRDGPARLHRRCALGLPLLALGLLFLWSFSHAFNVLRQAEQLSRGAPYCIGVFDQGSSRDSGGEYRAAELYDLSALQMRMDPVSTSGGNGSHLPGATALLEVHGPDGLRYWSWREPGPGLTGGFLPQEKPPPGSFILGEPEVEVVGCPVSAKPRR